MLMERNVFDMETLFPLKASRIFDVYGYHRDGAALLIETAVESFIHRPSQVRANRLCGNLDSCGPF
ncbi:MAG: hypothetical protein CMH81_07600 [Nitrospiraceae bacterium]|nr:hypothetical protein [Nitrospiraceae bacterium]